MDIDKIKKELMNPSRDYVYIYSAQRTQFVKCYLQTPRYREIFFEEGERAYMKVCELETKNIYRIHLRDYDKQYGWRFENGEDEEPDIY